MKTLIAFVFAFSSFLSFAQNKPLTTVHSIDPTATKVTWVGKKVTGQHSGQIAVKKGSLTFQGDLITAGDIIIDMNSLTVSDIPKSDAMNGKLVGHLKSPDFFNVEKNPEAKLVITGSEKAGKNLNVRGNLTMLGQTKPVEFLATINKTAKDIKAKSNIRLDRTKWGIKYGSGNWFKNLGDKAIDNEFTLAIELLAKKS